VPIHNVPNKFKTRVIFWEKNGLRHLEFNLPNFSDKFDQESSDLIINNLIWNSDGTILTLFVESTLNNDQYILFYVRSNYKWYLKYSVKQN